MDETVTRPQAPEGGGRAPAPAAASGVAPAAISAGAPAVASEVSDVPAPDLVDPAMAGTVPQTDRGRRTRAAIIAAARRVFERDGYLDSRLVDIASEASCSVGTLYTWFEGKDEVLAAVLLEAQHEMLHPGTTRFASSDDPVAIVRAANRAYFEAYARNAALNRLLDQVAVVDDRFHRMRMARADAFVTRNARAIHDLQERGLADRGVDAQIASLALSGMVSRLAQSIYVHGLDAPVDEVVEVATRLWTNALGLTAPGLGAGVSSAPPAPPAPPR
ncbi:TetR/AcrR family transcriptional regulator [Mobilicoccus pelagius]|uniref:Putative TetR family transcriptional regulator n=1 Tax=Mobilicoccus pelagius NBRC 104925 TaxID=1089455 RepID=H5UPL7_9MICO|nr:TetR/AcrR family transcriptional regulator [Mobilicoccus pelagius]GAB47675.1 putative TetR family transcriptional regulator [Mobilicoccus pelagius NBRC 104925]